MAECESRLYRSLRGIRTSLYTFRCQLEVLKTGNTQLQTREATGRGWGLLFTAPLKQHPENGCVPYMQRMFLTFPFPLLLRVMLEH